METLYCVFVFPLFSEKPLSHYGMASTQILISLVLVMSLVALGKIELFLASHGFCIEK